MASRAAIALCALAGYAMAEPAERPTNSPPPSAARLTQVRDAESQSNYLSDLSQIKNATLESESVFFDRLERQKKIEEVRFETTSVAQKLWSLRFKLSPLELTSLDQAEQTIDRATEPLDAAGKFIVAAHTEIRQFHEASTEEVVAIMAGKSDAAQFLSKIRRLIKSAEQSVRNASLNLEEAKRKLEEAGGTVKKSLGSLNEADPRHSDLVECAKAIDATVAELSNANDQANALIKLLESTRREHLPECAPTDSPALGLARKNSNNSLEKPNDCQGGSLAILKKSAPALDALKEAATQPARIATTLGRVKELGETAARYSEQSDAIVNPTHAKVRKLQAQANELLERAEVQLSDMKRLLTEDVPGETKECAHCGKLVIRTRKIVDPVCVCAKANAAMLDAEGLIRQARTIAEQMSETVGATKEEDRFDRTSPIAQARFELSGGKGVLEQLTLALQRGEEFRNQQLDFYQGDSTPPVLAEMPKRSFPPMVATYVARQSWHYPVYFEDLSAERYGLHHGCFQPIVSYGKFLADIALLPYNVCLDPPHSLQYDLGLYRPGDDVPHLIYLPRWDCKAALFEAGVWTGLMFTP